ncbi:MAG: DUF5696 domain-containing protein [bacterium]
MAKKSLLILLSFMTFLVIFLNHVYAVEELDVLNDMTVVAENEELILYLNENNTKIAIEEKVSGQIWFSNPNNINQRENIATGNVKNRLNAQLRIFFDTDTDFNRSKDNFNHSIDSDLFSIKYIDNGVRIEYQLGEEWSEDQHMPQFIPQDKFEEIILKELPEENRDNFQDHYTLFSIESRNGEEISEVPAVDVDKLFAEYIIKNPDQNKVKSSEFMGDLLDGIAERKGNKEDRRDITLKDLEPFFDKPTYYKEQIPPFIKKDMIEILLAETEYDANQSNQDLLSYNLDSLQREIEVFEVAIEYKLDGDNLLVTVPVDDIHFPEDVLDEEGNLQTYPLHTMELMPYLGAKYWKESGSILVPDGSGALINFSEESVTGDDYYGPQVYGKDYNEVERETQRRILQQTLFPVYGMLADEKSFLAIIEKGESTARIRAREAKGNTSFNVVYPSFNIIPSDTVPVGPSGELEMYQDKISNEDIQVRYKFYSDPNTDYAKLANYYRKYLEEEKNLENQSIKINKGLESIPLYLDIVGNALQKKPYFGVPRDLVTSLTDFGQTVVMVDDLLEKDIENINLTYQGWLEGGIEHIYPSKVDIEDIVGGQDNFTALNEYLKEDKINFYPEVNFMNVYRNNFWNGFKKNSDSAHDLEQKPLTLTDYSKINYEKKDGTERLLLSPLRLEELLESFFSEYTEYGVKGISLSDYGDMLYSDFKKNRHISRPEAAKINTSTLDYIKQQNMDTMVNKGNAYLLEKVNHIKNMPLTSSGFKIFDQEIPFYQIALHGLVEYTGKPLNLVEDYRYSLLKNLEYGASPYFKLIYEQADWLKNSKFDYLYSANFEVWEKEINNYYQKANEILKPVKEAKIIGHKQVGGDKFLTQYSNGGEIIVDYNDYSVRLNINGEEKEHHFE